MGLITKITTVTLIFLLICTLPCVAKELTEPPTNQDELGLSEYDIIRSLHQSEEETRPESQAAKKPLGILGFRRQHAYSDEQVERLNLLEDTTPRLSVSQIDIIGNTLISTESLFADMPLIYNASNQPLRKAQSKDLYDLRSVKDLSEPNEPREVSLRTIQGLTRYILSMYQKKNYAGIYVYVPKGVIEEGTKLADGILTIKVVEAPVSKVDIKFYDLQKNEVEESYLRRSALEDWSPVKIGMVANRKKLDDMVNSLNLNPDRYVTAVVSPGSEPNTLAVEYDVYETNPWHYFIQVDNSGTEERQWSPRIGLINTNLLGFDDKFTAVYQASPDSRFDENYSLYGSYDFPLMNPRLRLGFYGGYSEFDINPASGPFNYIGNGTFYGTVLRYNLYQQKGWFFDLTGSLSHEESKVTPSLFPQFLASDVQMDLWGIGANLYRKTDMTSTSLMFNRVQSMGGSSQRSFWDYLTGTGARMNVDRHFVIFSTTASHSRYLDKDKVQQLRGIVRWIRPTERLVPAKMTSFGGMYSVRGYDEYEIVADGGILASVQYEYDLVRHKRAAEPEAVENKDLKKLAPLCFVDFGRSSVKEPVPGEKRHQTLASVGPGVLVEIGNHFSGALYYGYPLKATADTRRGKGRLYLSAMLRW